MLGTGATGGGDVVPGCWGEKGSEADTTMRGRIEVLNPYQPVKMAILSVREVCGIRVVAGKCIDITQNPDYEGSMPASY